MARADDDAASDPAPIAPPVIDYAGLGTPLVQPPTSPGAQFIEIEFTQEAPDAVLLRHAPEDTLIPNVVLMISTAVFVLFVIVLVPLLNVTKGGRVLWTLTGFVILACVGFAMQMRTRVTEMRLDKAGLTIDQGTPLDREHVSIIWQEVAKVELEPVDPKDAARGMRLSIVPRLGEPILVLPDVAVGELNETRKMFLEHMKSSRTAAAKAATRKSAATSSAEASVEATAEVAASPAPGVSAAASDRSAEASEGGRQA